MADSIPFLDFKPLAEFTDRCGKIRKIAGCSVLSRLEFWERLEQIQQLLKECDQDKSWQYAFHSSERLQYLVNRCLELNGIDPDWLSFEHLQQMLFHRWDEEKGEFQVGWLVELNSPPNPAGATGKTEPLTREELIAAIATTCSNLKEALELAQNVRPADLLLNTLQAQAELKDPDARKRSRRRKTATKLKKELGPDKIKELINTPVDQLNPRP